MSLTDWRRTRSPSTRTAISSNSSASISSATSPGRGSVPLRPSCSARRTTAHGGVVPQRADTEKTAPQGVQARVVPPQRAHLAAPSAIQGQRRRLLSRRLTGRDPDRIRSRDARTAARPIRGHYGGGKAMRRVRIVALVGGRDNLSALSRLLKHENVRS